MLVLDDGSDHNYVSLAAAERLQAKQENAKPISLTFADSQKEIVTKKIVETVKVGGKEISVDFYFYRIAS